MSSQNKKKAWTFVPERSRAPPNKRATRRQTTLRPFTFVQDWDPRISPIPPSINNASQKKQRDRSQPTSSQSSESSIRESPIAQLVRSSPGPIIVTRRIPGSRDKSFKSPHPVSPSTSISSLSSSSSRQKTGVSPAFSVPRTRERERSKNKERSPVPPTGEEATASSPGISESGNENVVKDVNVSNVASTTHLQESVIDSVEPSSKVQSRSSTAKKNKRHGGKPSETLSDASRSQSPGIGSSSKSTRSRKRRGPSLTFQKKSSKGRTSLSFSTHDKNKSINVLDSIDETIPWDNERTEPSQILSASDDDHQATRTSSRIKQGANNTATKASAKGRTRTSSHRDVSNSTDVLAENDIPTPGNVTVSRRLSTSRDGNKSTTSRRKRGQSLTFKKKSKKIPVSIPQDEIVSSKKAAPLSSSSPPRTVSRKKLSSKSSESERSSSESDARGKSSSDSGNRSGGKSARSPVRKSVLKKKNATSKVKSKEVAKTPDRSMSFITTTPKSGHVFRRQPKIQEVRRSGQVKGKGPATHRKRGAGTGSSEAEEPVEKRAKVRLYTTGARPRLVGDTTDLDILFNCLEDTATEFRESLDAPCHRKAVSKFMDHARHELTNMISVQHDFKLQTLSLSRTNSSIRKYRNELLNLQRENTRLDVRIAESKKQQEKSEDVRAKTLKGIDLFISDLRNLHETYVSKYPKDIKSVEYVAQDDTGNVSALLKPTLETVDTAASLSNKLREWLGSR